MILHCVFMRLKTALQPAEKSEIYEAIHGLKALIPGIVDVKSGPNASSEGLNGGFLDGFIVTFDTLESCDAYLVHPDHITVAERIVAASDGGVSGLMVFDMAV